MDTRGALPTLKRATPIQLGKSESVKCQVGLCKRAIQSSIYSYRWIVSSGTNVGEHWRLAFLLYIHKCLYIIRTNGRRFWNRSKSDCLRRCCCCPSRHYAPKKYTVGGEGRVLRQSGRSRPENRNEKSSREQSRKRFSI